MITNKTHKLVVSVLLVLATITTTSAAPERYTQETADALFKAYYPHLANTQTHAVKPTELSPIVVRPVEIVPAPTEETPTPAVVPAAPKKPVVPAFLEEEEAEPTSTWKKIALAKTKAFVAKTKEVLSKPGAQAATIAFSIGAYTVTKAVKSALAQHSDKHGTEKLKAVFSSLKSAGLGKVLAGTQRSLSQDSSLKQAFVGIAVDSIVELATGALAKLTLSKMA